MNIDQDKANEYMEVRKKFMRPRDINLNQPFEVTEVLFSDLHGDIFKFDARQGRIELNIGSLNNRAHDYIVLMRLCIGKDKIHKNPDGQKIIGHHVHVYKEGFGDKIVYPAEDYGFEDSEDFLKSIKKFLQICNIDDSKFILQRRI